jgi:tetratricopeptide (TPR) repeat protein
MIFLHPEFLLWMSLPVGILFYFWLTQHIPQHLHFTPRAWKMLYVEETTLGLQGRNLLFLIASLLLILALSQPVVEERKIPLSPQPVTISLDISLRPIAEFEELKRKALTIIDASDAPIALVAYDTQLYRIAPSSEDKATLSRLIRHLSWRVMDDPHSDPTQCAKLPHPYIILSTTAPLTPQEQHFLHPKKEEVIYFPLFYLPLGVALLLIGLGLISMSKRESVALGMVAFLVVLVPPKANAGVMDFLVLKNAVEAYQKGHYSQSATLFLTYQRLHDTPQVRYNLANAYFKSGKYDQAAYWYAHVHTTDPHLAQWVAFNQRKLPHLTATPPCTTTTPRSTSITPKHPMTRVPSQETEGMTPLFSYP